MTIDNSAGGQTTTLVWAFIYQFATACREVFVDSPVTRALLFVSLFVLQVGGWKQTNGERLVWSERHLRLECGVLQELGPRGRLGRSV